MSVWELFNVRRRCRTAGLLVLLCALGGGRGWAQDPEPGPKQVNVSVKAIEFQATKTEDSGFSAYFRQQNLKQYGSVVSGSGAVTTADLTFPTSSQTGISVFLDRLNVSNYDLEVVLQAMVDESRALILSRPKAMVMVGSDVPTVIKTVQKVPYESTVVVGSTAVQVTEFESTGVTMTVSVPEIVDDDGNPNTRDDTYIHLVVQAEVVEEGQRIVVALDDQLAAGTQGQNAIKVPEFISRSLSTQVWVRNGQVLILGGLYRNLDNRRITSPPFLQQGEDLVAGVAQRFVPGDITVSPLSATLGNRRQNNERRELVFLIKADVWRPSYTVMEQFGFNDVQGPGKLKTPADVITDVLEEITGIPQGIAEGISREGTDRDIGSSLGVTE